MSNRIVAGLVAGATGTLALHVAAQVDAMLRGRAPSRSAAEIGARLADEIGLPLDYDLDAEPRPAVESQTTAGLTVTSLDPRVARRQEALGTLVGIGNGLAIGLAYGVVRMVVPRAPAWLAGAALGAVSMAAAEYPAKRLGLTEPERWKGTDWTADVVPHMAYGVATATAFEITRG